jgi:hypothetical protein
MRNGFHELRNGPDARPYTTTGTSYTLHDTRSRTPPVGGVY